MFQTFNWDKSGFVMYKEGIVNDEALEIITATCRSIHGSRGADLNAAKIAAVVGQVVSKGKIPPGDHLPTVRALAKSLRVSSSTVSDAWKILQAHAVISTDRRRGTTVRSTRGTVDGRYWHVPVAPGTLAMDLSTGTPDPSLLPPFGPVLAKLHLDLPVTSYLDDPVVPELEDLLRDRWPFHPEVLTIVDGAQDALDRLVQTIVRLGDTVVVEEPTFPPIIDMLEIAGAQTIGVTLDDEGLDLDGLRKAMVSEPVAIFIQPRAHNPTGVSMSPRRAEAIAEIIGGTSTKVIEDDHSGMISGADLVSLGRHLPNQTIHIHSFSKSHGPDLRLAAIGGPDEVLEPLVRRRHLGPSWTSRLLQTILLTLLRDPAAEHRVAEAAMAYQERRDSLARALEAEGVEVTPGSGINMWIPVPNEQNTLIALAASGVGVAPGRPFMVKPHERDYIRVTTAALLDGYDELARSIALAASRK